MNSICVFCGSKKGVKSIFAQTAIRVGKKLAAHDYELIYGGGTVGLMGILASTVIEENGNVQGVIPTSLSNREGAHPKVKLHKTSGMQERKTLMAELSDAFFILPGGYGTLDELFEMITWNQLGIHYKPVFILNTEGYYDALLEFIDLAISSGFIRTTDRKLFYTASRVEELFDKLEEYVDYREKGSKDTE